MPLVHLYVPEGRLSALKRKQLADGLARAVLAAERIEDTPEARMLSWIFLHEVPAESWIAGEGQDARYLVELWVPQGLLDAQGKAIAIEKVTEAVQAAEGPDVFLAAFGPWVIIREVPDGNWGAAGQVVRRQAIGEALHAG